MTCKGILILFFISCSVFGDETNIEFFWSQLRYQWVTDSLRQTSLRIGTYIPANNVPESIAIWRNKLFISVPRRNIGVPSTLNYVTIGGSQSPPLIPYPTLGHNYIVNVNGKYASLGKYIEDDFDVEDEELKDITVKNSLVSVFKLHVDKCNRLWAVDHGKVGEFGRSIQILSQPSIVIYDLITNTMIKRHFIKPSDLNVYSYLTNIVVDVDAEQCDDAFAYISDSGDTGGLLIYDYKKEDSWRVHHDYMSFDPLSTNFYLRNLKWKNSDAISGLALTHKQIDGSRYLLFHAHASISEFSVPNVILQNKTMLSSTKDFHDYFQLLGNRGPGTQSISSFFDESSRVLFFTESLRHGIGCWNTKNRLTRKHTDKIFHNAGIMSYPCDMKADNESKLWILDNNYPYFQYASVDAKDTNLRIVSISIDEALAGTRCEL